MGIDDPDFIQLLKEVEGLEQKIFNLFSYFSKKVLQKSLSAYSASLRDGSNKPFQRLSSRGEAGEERSDGSDGSSNLCCYRPANPMQFSK